MAKDTKQRFRITKTIDIMLEARSVSKLGKLGKVEQGKARHGKAKAGNARQGKARQGKAEQGKARQG